ncbi:MAG: hypothetical protein PHS14_13000 [Elusimicrobia bacterium]|nr:hypothetical protein [Elusimicrobiota bacterium]
MLPAVADADAARAVFLLDGEFSPGLTLPQMAAAALRQRDESRRECARLRLRLALPALAPIVDRHEPVEIQLELQEVGPCPAK